MATTPTVYVLCDANCKWESMTREQILTAITQAVETGEIGDINTGFVQTIKTINNIPLKFFVGTQAEYDALTAEDKRNLYAIITNDESITNIESAIAALEQNYTELINGLNSGSVVVKNAKYADSAYGAQSAVWAQGATKATNADHATTADAATNLTGEASLATVARAAYEADHADNADHATTADKVGAKVWDVSILGNLATNAELSQNESCHLYYASGFLNKWVSVELAYGTESTGFVHYRTPQFKIDTELQTAGFWVSGLTGDNFTDAYIKFRLANATGDTLEALRDREAVEGVIKIIKVIVADGEY